MPSLAVVTIPSDTGIPADSVTHNWVLDVDRDVIDATVGAIRDIVEDFYTVVPSGATLAPGGYLSPVLNITAGQPRLALYDLAGFLDGSPHGSPYYEAAIAVASPGAGTALPSEVACVLTLEAVGRDAAAVEVGVTRPKQRRTGRIFWGPLNNLAVQVTAGVARPASGVQLALANGAEAFHEALVALDNTGGSKGLGVWSRRDATVRPVEYASVDNAFDTQRRRGEGPTSRFRSAAFTQG